ncbi:hypothetical protein CAEBREN_03142 [Caenorhabditis brenneri]|uniref:Uncharacterized protein n=1 Tax=Caenorhabditis brenneri TaxID=135651 RepID=G0MI27_CAEBE|nr:hypothetical protein CAEBREN_03142 [Caenorhabditis brenneri]
MNNSAPYGNCDQERDTGQGSSVPVQESDMERTNTIIKSSPRFSAIETELVARAEEVTDLKEDKESQNRTEVFRVAYFMFRNFAALPGGKGYDAFCNMLKAPNKKETPSRKEEDHVEKNKEPSAKHTPQPNKKKVAYSELLQESGRILMSNDEDLKMIEGIHFRTILPLLLFEKEYIKLGIFLFKNSEESNTAEQEFRRARVLSALYNVGKQLLLKPEAGFVESVLSWEISNSNEYWFIERNYIAFKFCLNKNSGKAVQIPTKEKKLKGTPVFKVFPKEKFHFLVLFFKLPYISLPRFELESFPMWRQWVLRVDRFRNSSQENCVICQKPLNDLATIYKELCPSEIEPLKHCWECFEYKTPFLNFMANSLRNYLSNTPRYKDFMRKEYAEENEIIEKEGGSTSSNLDQLEGSDSPSTSSTNLPQHAIDHASCSSSNFEYVEQYDDPSEEHYDQEEQGSINNDVSETVSNGHQQADVKKLLESKIKEESDSVVTTDDLHMQHNKNRGVKRNLRGDDSNSKKEKIQRKKLKIDDIANHLLFTSEEKLQVGKQKSNGIKCNSAEEHPKTLVSTDATESESPGATKEIKDGSKKMDNFPISPPIHSDKKHPGEEMEVCSKHCPGPKNDLLLKQLDLESDAAIGTPEKTLGDVMETCATKEDKLSSTLDNIRKESSESVNINRIIPIQSKSIEEDAKEEDELMDPSAHLEHFIRESKTECDDGNEEEKMEVDETPPSEHQFSSDRTNGMHPDGSSLFVDKKILIHESESEKIDFHQITNAPSQKIDKKDRENKDHDSESALGNLEKKSSESVDINKSIPIQSESLTEDYREEDKLMDPSAHPEQFIREAKTGSDDGNEEEKMEVDKAPPSEQHSPSNNASDDSIKTNMMHPDGSSLFVDEEKLNEKSESKKIEKQNRNMGFDQITNVPIQKIDVKDKASEVHDLDSVHGNVEKESSKTVNINKIIPIQSKSIKEDDKEAAEHPSAHLEHFIGDARTGSDDGNEEEKMDVDDAPSEDQSPSNRTNGMHPDDSSLFVDEEILNDKSEFEKTEQQNRKIDFDQITNVPSQKIDIKDKGNNANHLNSVHGNVGKESALSENIDEHSSVGFKSTAKNDGNDGITTNTTVLSEHLIRKSETITDGKNKEGNMDIDDAVVFPSDHNSPNEKVSHDFLKTEKMHQEENKVTVDESKFEKCEKEEGDIDQLMDVPDQEMKQKADNEVEKEEDSMNTVAHTEHLDGSKSEYKEEEEETVDVDKITDVLNQNTNLKEETSSLDSKNENDLEDACKEVTHQELGNEKTNRLPDFEGNNSEKNESLMEIDEDMPEKFEEKSGETGASELNKTNDVAAVSKSSVKSPVHCFEELQTPSPTPIEVMDNTYTEDTLPIKEDLNPNSHHKATSVTDAEKINSIVKRSENESANLEGSNEKNEVNNIIGDKLDASEKNLENVACDDNSNKNEEETNYQVDEAETQSDQNGQKAPSVNGIDTLDGLDITSVKGNGTTESNNSEVTSPMIVLNHNPETPNSGPISSPSSGVSAIGENSPIEVARCTTPVSPIVEDKRSDSLYFENKISNPNTEKEKVDALEEDQNMESSDSENSDDDCQEKNDDRSASSSNDDHELEDEKSSPVQKVDEMDDPENRQKDRKEDSSDSENSDDEEKDDDRSDNSSDDGREDRDDDDEDEDDGKGTTRATEASTEPENRELAADQHDKDETKDREPEKHENHQEDSRSRVNDKINTVSELDNKEKLGKAAAQQLPLVDLDSSESINESTSTTAETEDNKPSIEELHDLEVQELEDEKPSQVLKVDEMDDSENRQKDQKEDSSDSENSDDEEKDDDRSDNSSDDGRKDRDDDDEDEDDGKETTRATGGSTEPENRELAADQHNEDETKDREPEKHKNHQDDSRSGVDYKRNTVSELNDKEKIGKSTAQQLPLNDSISSESVKCAENTSTIAEAEENKSSIEDIHDMETNELEYEKPSQVVQEVGKMDDSKNRQKDQKKDSSDSENSDDEEKVNDRSDSSSDDDSEDRNDDDDDEKGATRATGASTEPENRELAADQHDDDEMKDRESEKHENHQEDSRSKVDDKRNTVSELNDKEKLGKAAAQQLPLVDLYLLESITKSTSTTAETEKNKSLIEDLLDMEIDELEDEKPCQVVQKVDKVNDSQNHQKDQKEDSSENNDTSMDKSHQDKPSSLPTFGLPNTSSKDTEVCSDCDSLPLLEQLLNDGSYEPEKAAMVSKDLYAETEPVNHSHDFSSSSSNEYYVEPKPTYTISTGERVDDVLKVGTTVNGELNNRQNGTTSSKHSTVEPFVLEKIVQPEMNKFKEVDNNNELDAYEFHGTKQVENFTSNQASIAPSKGNDEKNLIVGDFSGNRDGHQLNTFNKYVPIEGTLGNSQSNQKQEIRDIETGNSDSLSDKLNQSLGNHHMEMNSSSKSEACLKPLHNIVAGKVDAILEGSSVCDSTINQSTEKHQEVDEDEMYAKHLAKMKRNQRPFLKRFPEGVSEDYLVRKQTELIGLSEIVKEDFETKLKILKTNSTTDICQAYRAIRGTVSALTTEKKVKSLNEIKILQIKKAADSLEELVDETKERFFDIWYAFEETALYYSGAYDVAYKKQMHTSSDYETGINKSREDMNKELNKECDKYIKELTEEVLPPSSTNVTQHENENGSPHGLRNVNILANEPASPEVNLENRFSNPQNSEQEAQNQQNTNYDELDLWYNEHVSGTNNINPTSTGSSTDSLELDIFSPVPEPFYQSFSSNEGADNPGELQQQQQQFRNGLQLSQGQQQKEQQHIPQQQYQQMQPQVELGMTGEPETAMQQEIQQRAIAGNTAQEPIAPSPPRRKPGRPRKQRSDSSTPPSKRARPNSMETNQMFDPQVATFWPQVPQNSQHPQQVQNVFAPPIPVNAHPANQNGIPSQQNYLQQQQQMAAMAANQLNHTQNSSHQQLLHVQYPLTHYPHPLQNQEAPNAPVMGHRLGNPAGPTRVYPIQRLPFAPPRPMQNPMDHEAERQLQIQQHQMMMQRQPHVQNQGYPRASPSNPNMHNNFPPAVPNLNYQPPHMQHTNNVPYAPWMQGIPNNQMQIPPQQFQGAYPPVHHQMPRPN